jgi:hypothetical protein
MGQSIKDMKKNILVLLFLSQSYINFAQSKYKQVSEVLETEKIYSVSLNLYEFDFTDSLVTMKISTDEQKFKPSLFKVDETSIIGDVLYYNTTMVGNNLKVVFKKEKNVVYLMMNNNTSVSKFEKK